MKKTILSLLLFLITASFFAQTIIEKPDFAVRKSSIYYPEKIELTDKETRFHVRAKILPGWNVTFRKNDFLKDCKTEKIYKIIGVEDYNLDEKITLPESGEQTFVLVFPPLEKGVKKIDYKHAIYEISLEKQRSKTANEVPKHVTKWIEKELKKVKTKPITDFNSDEFFNPKKAKLIGYIKGYDKRLGFTTGIVYQGNAITREDYPIVVQVYEDGRFEAEIPLIHPEINFLSIHKSYIDYYLEPGQTLAMILDWEDFLTQYIYRRSATHTNYKFQKTVYKGSLAEINKHLNKFTVEGFNYRTFKEKVKTLSFDEFRAEQDAKLLANKNLLKSYIKNNNVNHKTEQLLLNNLITESATLLFDFVKNSDYEATKNELFANLRTNITNDYYSFLQEIDWNNKAFLVPNRFATFVNRYEFSTPMNIYANHKFTGVTPKMKFDDYLKKHNITLTENDKKLREESKGKRFKSYEEYKDFREKYSKPYKDALKAHNLKYIKPLVDKQQADITDATMEKWRLRDSVLTNVYHLNKNIVHDMTKIRALKFDIDRTDAENARKYWDTLKKTIDDSFLIAQGERIVHKKFPIVTQLNDKDLEKSSRKNIALSAKTVKLPKGKPSSIFNNIIKSHKGKILFVDFWATSCGPCVGSIKRMKEIRAKYKDNPDIDFVFITSKNQSPEKRYTDFVENQNLVNTYRVSSDEFNYLRQLFKFNGIPRYVVIAKNGEVIDDHYKMYTFNNTIDDIIKKYK
jgi:thiol-disulfide isomerase/thioredoxin